MATSTTASAPQRPRQSCGPRASATRPPSQPSTRSAPPPVKTPAHWSPTAPPYSPPPATSPPRSPTKPTPSPPHYPPTSPPPPANNPAPNTSERSEPRDIPSAKSVTTFHNPPQVSPVGGDA